MGISTTWRTDCNRWEVVARRKGKRKKRLAPEGMGSRAAGIEIGPQLLREMEEEERGQTALAERRPTLWQFCQEVYAHKHGVSERTWHQRRFKVAGVMADLGDHLLTEITTPVVTDWLELLQADGAPKKRGGRGQPLEEGGAALNDYLVTLKAIFRVAVENDYIEKVPFRNKLAPIDLATDREAWSPAMKGRLLTEAAKLDPLMHRLAEFLMLTGCRPIEALRLRWEHVQEIPKPTVTITGKGFRYRKLPLTGELGAFFKRLARSGDAIFPVENGKTEGERFKFWPYRRWEAVCTKAKVSTVAYDLRHTFITEMVVKGVPLPMIAKWAGNSVRVIEERYSHLSPEFLEGVASKVGTAMPNQRPREASPEAESALPDGEVASLE
ncbi:site-specific integrase [Myxococcota bacterium]|nr:site-specific integrase [Myxococcota bacterium]